jgi:hypothetical protein
MNGRSNEQNARSSSAFRAILAIDYTVIFVRDMLDDSDEALL